MEPPFEHSYDNDGLASLNEIDPDDSDHDADAYDKMRDDTCEELVEQINEMFKYFVEHEGNGALIYYKGSPERFWEHLKSECDFRLELLEKNKSHKK